MNTSIACFLACLATIDPLVGIDLQYTGTLSQRTATGMNEVKSFTLNLVSLPTEEGRTQFAFHVEERGAGGWGWPEHFGVISLSTDDKTKASEIRLLYSHDEVQYPLRVQSPYFEFRDKLVPQSEWSDGRKNYAVTRSRKIKERNCQQVEVSSSLGKLQTLVVETDSGLLMQLEERVIIGRGDEYILTMELASQSQLDDFAVARQRQVLVSLLAIQSQLNRSGEQKSVELTQDQWNSITAEFPRIEKLAESTSWSRFVAALGRDLQQQQKRLAGIAGWQKKLVDQPAPEWDLKLVDGRKISDTDLQGKVVVLHFWQYRGEPLIEPYGQIGYLDFLNNKRKKLGAVVIGVNVDERFANPKQASAATRTMKQLLEFMRIGYDMATDDGSVLAKFGDPRDAGAALPLWVVIGHDGKVAHHHTGFYDIKPDEGLKALDDAVVQALRRKGN